MFLLCFSLAQSYARKCLSTNVVQSVESTPSGFLVQKPPIRSYGKSWRSKDPFPHANQSCNILHSKYERYLVLSDLRVVQILELVVG